MCNNSSLEPRAQDATGEENTEGDLYNMNSETEEFESDEEHRPARNVISDENAIGVPMAAGATGGGNSDVGGENSAHCSTPDGMEKKSQNLIDFSPDKSAIVESGNVEKPSTPAVINVGENIAEACGRISISDTVQVGANIDVDPNVKEEECGSDDANASNRSDDSDVVLVMEYFLETESELAEEHDIKQGN